MGTHLVDEGYAAQLDSLGSDSGQTLWGVKSDRSAPSNRRSGAGHHGTTITRFSRSEEHTSELQSLMRISYAVFCLNKKRTIKIKTSSHTTNISKEARIIESTSMNQIY